MQEHQRYCSQLLVLLVLFIISLYVVPILGKNGNGLIEVDVGVILDADDHMVGKVSQTCISMALEDFYTLNQNHSTTRIVLHKRDSKGDVVEAASAAIDLLKNVQVQAILGPQRSSEAEFVIDIGNKTQVPIISQATSPSLSPAHNPYFIRGAQNGSSQVESLTAIVQAFGWREVVLIYEDTNYGRGVVPFLINSFLGINTQVRYQSVLSLSASDDHILEELYKLMTMQTRVFVVHMLPFLASRFFTKVKQAKMMNTGYAWIITDGLTSLLDSMDPTVINSMQGVIGVKPYVQKTSQLKNFKVRWKKRFRQENPDVDIFEMNVFGLWAYDSVTALAMAVERSGIGASKFKKLVTKENLTDLAAIGISKMGPRLLQSLQNIEFNGLNGKFHLLNGQLQLSSFQIVNVIGKGDRKIGFWTRKYGISKNLRLPISKNYSTNKDDLGAIIWPGESNVVPKGWEMSIGEAKLRVGVPVNARFKEIVSVRRDPQTNAVIATGFCIDVFKEVMDHYLPYAVPYEFLPFETPDGKNAGSYNDLVYQIFLGNYDAVVGDVTILSNRSRFVDFTLPYMEAGVAMIVPFEDDDRKNAWIFMKPLKMDLWFTTGFFFVFTGFVVWVVEHRVNEEFRGPPGKQVGMIFWFSFSTLVFAHKEKLTSNLSRFVVIVWIFVVLVLTSSYTASLTSMLTVQKLKPSITDIRDLIHRKEYVGYPEGSFIEGLLKNKEFDTSKLKNYSTLEKFDEALSKGSKNGGVAAIFLGIPHIKLFLSNPKYCTKYTMVGPIFNTAGLGFAFPKGSPLVPDVSRAILNVTGQDIMTRIKEKWLGEGATCAEQDGAKVVSDSLTLDSFKGLFIVAAIASFFALILFLSIFLFENWDTLASHELSIREKLIAMAKTFHEEKDNSSYASKRKPATGEGMGVPATTTADCPQSPATSDSRLAEWIFSHGEGLSTTETSTPIHETIEIVESSEER
ncbi:glutamate receptor 2.2-like isoform X2 [Rhododendron vialii]|uniref:glutamate receptor 2.2-like isoform X2 n=1 Tax=Rhododendron vialii TaxID=182163 RepID=UPI00265DD739|nr:glutamate receptor 2.2-like isoform X2 [Rhododendron vialii]XP_058210534.1 glutamate receptor 2.2-like isoform X2 [Rhododendron vialii]